MTGIANAEAHAQDGDQHNKKEETATRFEEGKENAHNLLDSKDERSIANNLAAAAAAEKKEKEDAENKPRPTEIAESHGNKPSRGAILDQRIEDEEREELERKGKA